MTKGKRKKTIRRPKSPTIVSPVHKATETVPLPPDAAKLEPGKSVLTSKEIFIMAPVERCFDMLASQLEQPRQWDTTIVDVKPVSDGRGRIGATSQVTLNLGGKEVESLVMISRYHPNRAISWVFTGKPKVREDWRLESKPDGTMVGVTFAYEVPGWVIRRFLYKIMRRKKLEQDLGKMLTQLKAVAESISHDQKVIGKRGL
jgi:uncharacterized membrane protein